MAARAFPLLSLGQLAHVSGASYPYLREVVSRSRDPYNSIAKSKRDGGVRQISVPEPVLADVQRWILSNCLNGLIGSPVSFAYQRGRSIVQCAAQHVGAKWMVKMDLHDFFSSVKEDRVYRCFRRMGYSKLVAFELGRICTRAKGARPISDGRRISIYSVNALGELPQGAPTSGQLANAAASRLDSILQEYALENRLAYTRYSDDLFFSSHEPFHRGRAVNVVRSVSEIVMSCLFEVHEKKTRIVPPGARRVVLGLLVEDRVRLVPEFRRRVEVHLRGCEKFGLAAHSAHRGFDSPLSFANHLDGLISFSFEVEPSRAAEWRRRLDSLLEKCGAAAFS